MNRIEEVTHVSKYRTLRFLTAVCAVASSAVMLACGGPPGPGPVPAANSNAPAPASIVVPPNPLIAKNLANGEVTVTFAAISATGQAVADVPLVLSADTTVSISPAVATTDASGAAT